jgi:hypothetical protein
MKAPVPRGTGAFHPLLEAPAKKMIFASSPPSSMTASVSGIFHGRRTPWASPLHKPDAGGLRDAEAAEPVITVLTLWPDRICAAERSCSAAFSRTLE